MSSRTAFRRTTASHPGQVTGSRSGPRDVPSLAPLVWGPHIPYDVPDAMISRPGAMNFRVLRDRVWRAGQRRARLAAGLPVIAVLAVEPLVRPPLAGTKHNWTCRLIWPSALDAGSPQAGGL